MRLKNKLDTMHGKVLHDKINCFDLLFCLIVEFNNYGYY